MFNRRANIFVQVLFNNYTYVFLFTAVYIGLNMMQTTVSIILTILILRISHSGSSRPVPGCVRVLVLHCLAGLVCMCRTSRSRDRPNKIIPTKEKDDVLVLEDVNQKKTSLPGDGAIRCVLSDDVMEMLSRADDIVTSRCHDEKDREDWLEVGRVLDRFFFFFFFLLILAEIGGFVTAIVFKLDSTAIYESFSEK